MRTLAIDLGNRRVGLAISDEGGRFASPMSIIEITSTEQAFEPILDVIKSEGVMRIILGLPLNMDDTIGPAAKAVIKWGKELSTRSTLPVVYVDERLSSFQAEQGIIDRKRGGEKITRGQKKSRLDALAAAGFLQEYLDGKLLSIPVD